MKSHENIILGLFFADEDNLVFDNIKYSDKFTDMKINDIKMLSYKFLGPVFLTAAISTLTPSPFKCATKST